MKGILDEIKQQPPHIREIFMWVCVVITFSIIGYAWFRVTTKQFVALLNPEQAEETRALAQEKTAPLPFATILTALKDLRANIFELFDLSRKTNNFEIENPGAAPSKTVAPQKLPLAPNK